MPQIHSKYGKPALALLVLALTGVLLAACGGSSNSTPAASTGTTTATKNTSASATVPTTPTTTSTGSAPTTTRTPTTTAPGPRLQRFSALRECLQKEGVTLPQRKPGQGGPGSFGAGGLPAGVSRSKLQAALKKCDSALKISPGQGHFFGNNPAIKQAYAKFATCMREHGVNLPEPNTSGNGPIFDTKGIDTSSATFKAAEAKCRSDLFGGFHVRPGVGAPGASGAGGAAATG